ncbi:MAG: hypothetical protein FRX49_08930 [Trebouxia sp. A1-2]|nr:MAG: hypothetical protein FRX49_08930 [Trebouxia sp. A1-2]
MALSLWALVADPMHQLLAAKGNAMGVDAICSIALIVPFKQQRIGHLHSALRPKKDTLMKAYR